LFTQQQLPFDTDRLSETWSECDART